MKKIMKNKKGIDTILAALLMVVIVVVASVMVYAWSTGLLGALMGGANQNVGKEALILDSGNGFFNSGTNVTLNLRNTGTAAVSLASYYVKDSAGNQYARTSWSTGPNVPGSINPNGVGVTFVLINTTCGTNCALTGSAFTFTSGYSYTINVVTTRNTQFSFTVTR